MNKIEAHITRLFRDIPDSRRKRETMQEIIQNLGEKVSDLVSQGYGEDEAVKTALEDFGDIDDIRIELESSAQIEQSKNLGLSLAFSIWGSLLITGLFLFINLYYSPNEIWFVYPVFAVAWWPAAMFFHWLSRKSGRSMAFPFSLVGFALLLGLVLFINFYYSPRTIWFVYPTFGIIWWPVALFFHQARVKNRRDDDYE